MWCCIFHRASYQKVHDVSVSYFGKLSLITRFRWCLQDYFIVQVLFSFVHNKYSLGWYFEIANILFSSEPSPNAFWYVLVHIAWNSHYCDISKMMVLQFYNFFYIITVFLLRSVCLSFSLSPTFEMIILGYPYELMHSFLFKYYNVFHTDVSRFDQRKSWYTVINFNCPMDLTSFWEISFEDNSK